MVSFSVAPFLGRPRSFVVLSAEFFVAKSGFHAGPGQSESQWGAEPVAVTGVAVAIIFFGFQIFGRTFYMDVRFVI